ncbi:GNAT family N-acetyltransferase [Plantactinospora sp. GCM10030261]|uniref:GNAT family N-acetyltransferase n=1 Tax=Plantactinospora sp. GCM10030261 TaxID=3273420 RepID=UPI003616634D
MHEIEIRAARFDSPEATRLVTAALADLGARYGGNGDDTPVRASEFVPPTGDFLIAHLAGEAVGCGGWRGHDARVAELKRMFVMPTARGRGVARALLAAVERSARNAGRERIILECGDKQPEAIALYESSGYRRIENFGYYRDWDGCVSFGRALT